jgi:DNA-binding NarL/FixJ family response regulator
MDVVIADKRSETRSALRLLLEEAPGVRVTGEADDRSSLVSAVRALRPDVVLVDWELADGAPSGAHDASLPADVRDAHAGVKVVALSVRPEAGPGALAAGADAFVSKTDPPENLLAALTATDVSND